MKKIIFYLLAGAMCAAGSEPMGLVFDENAQVNTYSASLRTALETMTLDRTVALKAMTPHQIQEKAQRLVEKGFVCINNDTTKEFVQELAALPPQKLLAMRMPYLLGAQNILHGLVTANDVIERLGDLQCSNIPAHVRRSLVGLAAAFDGPNQNQEPGSMLFLQQKNDPLCTALRVLAQGIDVEKPRLGRTLKGQKGVAFLFGHLIYDIIMGEEMRPERVRALAQKYNPAFVVSPIAEWNGAIFERTYTVTFQGASFRACLRLPTKGQLVFKMPLAGEEKYCMFHTNYGFQFGGAGHLYIDGPVDVSGMFDLMRQGTKRKPSWKLFRDYFPLAKQSTFPAQGRKEVWTSPEEQETCFFWGVGTRAFGMGFVHSYEATPRGLDLFDLDIRVFFASWRPYKNDYHHDEGAGPGVQHLAFKNCKKKSDGLYYADGDLKFFFAPNRPDTN